MEKFEDVAERIEDINNEVWDQLFIGSRPYGDKWLRLVSIIMKCIVDAGLVQHLNKYVEDILIDDNYHTAASAVSALMELRKYAGYR